MEIKFRVGVMLILQNSKLLTRHASNTSKGIGNAQGEDKNKHFED